ncbi:MAG: extracellular solute-binding protein [Spirochaetaceae bacterium]
MYRRNITIVGTLLLFLSSTMLVFGAGQQEEGVDPRELAENQDWAEIERLAREEGEVVTYNTSSRVQRAGDAFEERYGISVRMAKMSGTEIQERVIREQAGDVFEVDLVMTDDLFGVNEMLAAGNVWNFFPDTFEDVVAEENRNPLIKLVLLRAMGYNTEAYPEGEPFDNMWALTTEEWRGRFALRDPETTAVTMSFFAEIVTNPEPWEAAYRDYFGEDIELTTENAGWEFVKRLAENQPITVASDADAAEAVGSRGQARPPVGLYTISRHRDIERENWALDAMVDAEPTVGYQLPVYLLQVTNAPNPHAAMLFTRFLMSDEGAAAWTVDIGGFSTNLEASFNEDTPLGGLSEWDERTTTLDIDTTVRYLREVSDFWILHRE